MRCTSFPMLDGPCGTGCDVPVLGCWDCRDVIVAAVFDCVKEYWHGNCHYISTVGKQNRVSY